jgi:hypothetical protein
MLLARRDSARSEQHLSDLPTSVQAAQDPAQDLTDLLQPLRVQIAQRNRRQPAISLLVSGLSG